MPYFSVESAPNVRPSFYPAYKIEGLDDEQSEEDLYLEVLGLGDIGIGELGLKFSFKKVTDFFKKVTGREDKKIPRPPPPAIDPVKKRVYDYLRVPPGKIKIIEKTPNMMIIKRYDGYYYLQNRDDSGWMEWGDWYNWKTWIVNREFRRANRHKQGYRKKADLLLTGMNKKQVEAQAAAAYRAMKKKHEADARKKGWKRLTSQTEKFLKQHGGKLLMAAGSVATLIPVVGWIVGPAAVIAGKMLDKHQTARMQELVARRRKRELAALKAAYEKGEISSEEYQKRAQKICADEVKNIMAEEQQAKMQIQQQAIQAQQAQQVQVMEQRRIATVRKIPMAPARAEAYIQGRPYDPKAPKEFPTGAVAIGGSIAIAGLGIAVAIAIAARK